MKLNLKYIFLIIFYYLFIYLYTDMNKDVFYSIIYFFPNISIHILMAILFYILIAIFFYKTISKIIELKYFIIIRTNRHHYDVMLKNYLIKAVFILFGILFLLDMVILHDIRGITGNIGLALINMVYILFLNAKKMLDTKYFILLYLFMILLMKVGGIYLML